MSATLRSWLVSLLWTVLIVVLSVAYVDRPVADLFLSHPRSVPSLLATQGTILIFLAVVPLGLFCLLYFAISHATGKALPAWMDTPVLCSFASTLAIAGERVLKFLFGRYTTTAYTSLGTYGFLPLQGAQKYSTDSFPSGTAIVAASIAMVLWTTRPRLRIPTAAITVLLCALLVVNLEHWLGDVVAGAYVGALLGWAAVHIALGMGERHPGRSAH